MELKYGHLADYAGEGANAKLMLVGIFDQVFAVERGPHGEVSLPMSYLAFRIEASVGEGSTGHQLSVRFVNDDGDHVTEPLAIPELPLRSSGPGRPLATNVITFLGGLAVPDLGDYAFEVWVDDRLLGSVPLYVLAPPPVEPPTA